MMLMHVESSLAVVLVVGFITALVYYSIISPKITSQEEFLSNQIIKRQLFCFLVCIPPFYIITLSISRIVLFPENFITLLYEVYRCSQPSSSPSPVCDNFDEVAIIISLLTIIIIIIITNITRGFFRHYYIHFSCTYFSCCL
jgi:hypothetical protein